MEVIYRGGQEGLAKVFVAKFRHDERLLAEFVSSLSGSPSAQVKWVAILSSQFGCPVGCRFCDAGGHFQGNLTAAELMEQLEFLVQDQFGGSSVPSKKFKVQFARMGEPALNPAVPDALERLARRFGGNGLMPCVSTVAPASADEFFERLMELRKKYFFGSFQLQFSVHTTDDAERDRLIPCRKWNWEELSVYGARFHAAGGGRKVSLNFALTDKLPLDARVLEEHFDPAHFAVKLTPVNPTGSALQNGLVSSTWEELGRPLAQRLGRAGFEVVISAGDARENLIGSNCGQLVTALDAHPTLNYK